MSKYIVKTDIFRYFDFGDVIIPYNNGHQYGKKGSIPGDNVIPPEFIEKMPEYFEKIEPGVKEGQYFGHDNCIFRVSETNVRNLSQLLIRAKVVSGYLKNHNDFFSEKYVRNNLLSYDEVKQALTKEAKRREYNPDNFKDIDIPSEKPLHIFGYQYCAVDDALLFANKICYKQGQWAEKIEDEWKVKWGGMRISGDIEQSVNSGMAYWYVTDGDTELKFAGMSEQQAEAIKNALNDLS